MDAVAQLAPTVGLLSAASGLGPIGLAGPRAGTALGATGSRSFSQ